MLLVVFIVLKDYFYEGKFVSILIETVYFLSEILYWYSY